MHLKLSVQHQYANVVILVNVEIVLDITAVNSKYTQDHANLFQGRNQPHPTLPNDSARGNINV